MAKMKRESGAKKCVCSKCNLEVGSAIAGKTHRRCSGNAEGNNPRPKSDYIPASDRGTWA